MGGTIPVATRGTRFANRRCTTTKGNQMANKTLFSSTLGKLLPRTDAVNSEQAPAYAFTPKHALAQYAVTGCLNGTFYASAEAQLETVLKLSRSVAPEYVAKTAIYCRERGFMKDIGGSRWAPPSKGNKTLTNIDM